MEEKVFTIGPWGGKGGDKWDDMTFSGVREIHVEHFDYLFSKKKKSPGYIMSLTLVYDDPGKRSKAAKHGGSNPKLKAKKEKIKLKYPGEFLVGISGHYSPLHAMDGGNPYIRSLKFISNKSILDPKKKTGAINVVQETYGPYGVEEGTPFDFKMKDFEIVGFHGRSGWYLDSIGIHLRHREAPKEADHPLKGPEKKDDDSALGKYGEDLTELAKAGKLDKVSRRDGDIRRCIQVLSRRTKNNPVLVGEPGVGKTAIVHGLAQRIVEGEVPQVLMNRRLVSLDIGGLVAGSELRGQFEDKLKAVLKQVSESEGETILFIDEIHIIVGAGAGVDSSMDAANLLKPMLSSGQLQCIGATTLDEHRRFIEKDPALERRFQQVYVEPSSVADTIKILNALREKYEQHHGVPISTDALTYAANVADQYITSRFLPDKGGKYPGVSASALRARFKSKKLEKEGSSSKPDKGGLESEVNKPSQGRRKVIFKRKRGSDTIEIEDSGDGFDGKEMSVEELSRFVESQKPLHGFTEGESSSLWSKSFPYTIVADEIFQSEVDKSLAEGTGDIAIDQFLQVIGLRIASLGRSQEVKHRMLLPSSDKVDKLNEELVAKDKIIADLETKLLEKEKGLTDMKEKYEKEAEALRKRNSDLTSLQEKMVEVTVTMKEMEKAKQTDILDAFIEGFERAVLQAKFLLPDQDLSKMDPSKIVRDGALVEDEEVVEDAADNLNEGN